MAFPTHVRQHYKCAIC